MKRVLLVLTVALMMAAMVVVMAAPAFALPTGKACNQIGAHAPDSVYDRVC